MRLLVTGFPPFPGRPVNPTQALVEAVARGEFQLPGVDVRAALLPVEYEGVEAEFSRLVDEIDPDVVLSFGVAPQEVPLRLERRAFNRDCAAVPDNAGVVRFGGPIRGDGPEQIDSLHDLPALRELLRQADLQADVSDDAGAYICNHLNYFAQYLNAQRERPYRFLFTHVSHRLADFPEKLLLAALHIMADWFHNQHQPAGERSASSHRLPTQKATPMPDISAAEYWMGFDLGGTKMLAQVYDADWKVIGKERKRIHPGTSAKGGVERIVETIREALKKANVESRQLKGLGIGCPGPIDMDAGTLTALPNLGWDSIPMKQKLEAELGCPVAVLNDVDAGTYAEYRRGAGQGARCVIGVFAGTGIGGGCIYQGEILRGQVLSAFEIGHVQVMSNGPRCGCGQRGCLESVSSRLAIASQAARAAYRGDAPHLLEKAGTNLADIRSGALAESIAAGDKAIEDIIREAARYIGIAISGVVHLLSPDVVVLGGGLVEAMPDLFVSSVSRAATKRVMPAYRDRFKILPAALKDDAGVLGAALWAEHALSPGKK